MTTAEKLREALHTVEPGWQVTDVEGVRKRARRIRLKRRIAGALAVAAATVTVVGLAPAVMRHHEPGRTTASLGADGALPTTVAEARTVTRFSPHTGRLPKVTAVGNEVAIPYVSGWKVQLMPPGAGDEGAGRICVVGDPPRCRQLRRSSDGWVTDNDGSAGNISQLQAAEWWVVDGPVGVALATVLGQSVPVEVRALGDGYQLISARMPVEADGEHGMAVSEPDGVWVFDPEGQLIARQRR